jgi:hypothetical protein
MAVVAGAGQSLGRDGPVLRPAGRLQDVEQGKANRLLELGVAVQLHVGAMPEVIEISSLIGQEPVPSPKVRRGEGGGDLVPQGRHRALPRPAVGQELDDPQPVARFEVGGDGEACQVRLAHHTRLGDGWPLDDVVHPRPHAQLAGPRRVDEHGLLLVVPEKLCA